MKRIIILLVWCGVLISLGMSCKSIGPNASISTVTPEILPNWWTSWLAHPVCKPPCWQKITPGVTTMKEAASILGNSPEIKIDFQVPDGIDWTFKQNKDEGGTLKASPNGKVGVMWIENVSARKLLLQTIIASYGNPKYVYPYDCREGMCSTALVYPDMGMFLSIFIKNEGVSKDAPQIEILSETVVNRVYFIEPGIEKFQIFFELQDSNSLIQWKGYGEYP